MEENSQDFPGNAKSFGVTPPFHRVAVVRGEILYIPDRDNYPAYWELKDKEALEACKLKCSCKPNTSLVIDHMRNKKLFFNLEEFAILKNYPEEVSIKVIEEEYFELSRTELLVLTSYENITPFVYYQLAKEYSNKDKLNYTNDKFCCVIGCRSDKGRKLLLLRNYLNNQTSIIISWQDYVAFLKEREFDVPQYTVPEC